MDPTQDKDIVKLGEFVFYISKTDEARLILKQWNMIASMFEICGVDYIRLEDFFDKRQYENFLMFMFQEWIKKVQEKNQTPTLANIAQVFKSMDINSVEVSLTQKFERLDKLIVVPKPPEPPAIVQQDDTDQLKTEETTAVDVKEEVKENGKDGAKDPKEKAKSGSKKSFFSKKVKKPKELDVVGGVVDNPLAVAATSNEEEEPVEIKYLSEAEAKQLRTIVNQFPELDTSLQIIEMLSKTLYHVAAVVPKEDNWIQKVALIAMEMFSIVRHFIMPGRAVYKNKLEGVVRRYVTDPGLAPDLINALVVGGLFIPKEGEKKAVILIEPAVKEAIDEILEWEDSHILHKMEAPYPSLAKVQEKLLVAVVAAVEEHKNYDDQKAFGKKLGPHISYLVKEIVWPRKHPGFNNLQAKIPKVIRFCSESVIAVAKQRYASLPNVSDEDMAIFEKAYKKAQEEMSSMKAALMIGAGAAVGVVGVGALTVGAIASID